MNKIKCKRCGNRNARFDKKRQRYSSCLSCLQEIKSQNKLNLKISTNNQSNVNEVYRVKLRLLFLLELQKIKPKLFQKFESELVEKYKNEFGTDFAEFQDVVSDKLYSEFFSKEFYEFAQIFIEWLNKWNLNNQWVAEFFLNKLYNKDSKNFWLDLPIKAYFLPSRFEFEFPGIESDIETEKEYRKRFDDAFKKARKSHFDLIKNAKSDFTNFSIKQKHIKWLIDYHFERKTFKRIAEIEQETYFDVGNEAIRKAVNQIANDLPFVINVSSG